MDTLLLIAIGLPMMVIGMYIDGYIYTTISELCMKKGSVFYYSLAERLYYCE